MAFITRVLARMMIVGLLLLLLPRNGNAALTSHGDKLSNSLPVQAPSSLERQQQALPPAVLALNGNFVKTAHPTNFPTPVPTPEPYEVVQDSITGISLAFPSAHFRDDLSEWEAETKFWLEDFYQAQEGLYLIFDVTTELTVTNQAEEIIDGVRTITLTWTQSFSYKAYRGARSTDYYAVAPFLRYVDSFSYGLHLRNTVEGYERLRIPLDIPVIATQATAAPVPRPTRHPTVDPTVVPTGWPTTAAPTFGPTSVPTTVHPTTVGPTWVPSEFPTFSPTAVPTVISSSTPTASPLADPTTSPTLLPTAVPTTSPTLLPTETPTDRPSLVPTMRPTLLPTKAPTSHPTASPTALPTKAPTGSPTALPTKTPTASPTSLPTTDLPSTAFPTLLPSAPPTDHPSVVPTTASPTTSNPPSPGPTRMPSIGPTLRPTTERPSTGAPPSESPTIILPPSRVNVIIVGVQVTFENSGALLQADRERWENITTSWFLNYYNSSTEPSRRGRQLQRNDPTVQVDQMSTTIAVTNATVTVDPATNVASNTILYDQTLSYNLVGAVRRPVAYYAVAPFQDATANAEYAQQIKTLTNFDNIVTPIAEPNVPVVRVIPEIEGPTGTAVSGGGLAGIAVGAAVIVLGLGMLANLYYSRRLNSYGESSNDRLLHEPSEVLSEEDSMRAQEVDEKEVQPPDSPSVMEPEVMERTLTENFAYDKAYVVDEQSFATSIATEEAKTSVPGFEQGSSIGGDEEDESLASFAAPSQLTDQRDYHSAYNLDEYSMDAVAKREESIDYGSVHRVVDTVHETVSVASDDAPLQQTASTIHDDTQSSTASNLGQRKRSGISVISSRSRRSTGSGRKSLAGTSIAGGATVISETSSLKVGSILSSRSSSTTGSVPIGMREETVSVLVPPGTIGVIIDTPDEGPPVVHSVKAFSPVHDQVQVGDKLMAVDDQDVTQLTAIKVSKLISRKSANPARKLTLKRLVQSEDP